MKQLAKQRATCSKKAQDKVAKDWSDNGFKDLSESQLVKSGFKPTIKGSGTEPMWQVVMDLTFLWCKEHKNLISHETVSAIKKKARGISHVLLY